MAREREAESLARRNGCSITPAVSTADLRQQRRLRRMRGGTGGLQALIAAVGPQFPCTDVVGEIVLQGFVEYATGKCGIDQRECGLHATQEVPFEPVGTGAEQVGRSVVREPVNAMM